MHCKVSSPDAVCGNLGLAENTLSKKLVVFVLLFFPLVSIADKYDQGLTAYSSGKYADALSIWKSPELGKDSRALFSLGSMYMSGKGVEKNEKQAVEYYAHSAELGNNSAQFNLGLAYYKGKGVEKNIQQAALFWEEAGNGGHGGAQYNYAALLWEGIGIEQDQAKAMKWFRVALANGNEQAAKFLYSLFEPMYSELQANHELYRGEGTTRKIPLIEELGMFKLAQQAMAENAYDQAFEYWMPLANDGHDQSQFEIGQLYEQGKGVEENFDKAMEWYEIAAKAGNPDAQFRIGLYHINEAPEKNRTLGLYWIQSAADQELQEAIEFMKSGG